MISMDKNYRTKDGKEVRLYAIDGIGLKPVHGAMLYPDGWEPSSWSKDGDEGYKNDNLIEVMVVPEYWVVFSERGKPHYVTKVAPTYDLPEGQFAIHHPAQEKPA